MTQDNSVEIETPESTVNDKMVECQRMTDAMFRLQFKFNNETNGDCWVDGVTKEGRKIDWVNCIKMEASEMVDCFPWKHWKSLDEEFDQANFEVELVDVHHFVMSEVLSVAIFNTKKMHEQNGTEFNDAVLESVLSELGKTISYETFYNSTIEDLRKDIDQEDLLLNVVKLFRDKTDTVDSLLSHFFAILSIMQEKYGFGFKDLYKLYIGKNALNKFRQNNGYKDGSYLKVWPLKTNDETIDAAFDKLGGFEDNVFMKQILDKNPGITFDELYDALDVKYKEALTAKEK